MKHMILSLLYKYRNNCIVKLIEEKRTNRRNRKRRKLFLLNGQELLKHLKSCLDSNNILFWLDFGTLLGAYREHDFIKHDCDLDIGVFWEDAERVRNALLGCGKFKLVHEFRVGKDGSLGLEQTYMYKGVTVDVFCFHKLENRMYCNSFSQFGNQCNPFETHYQVKEITVPFSGFKQMLFKDLLFNVPAKTEEHLQCHYGLHFMIPDANFDYKKVATNIRWFSKDERIGVFTRYTH